MKRLLTIILIAYTALNINAQTFNVKREFRGAWIATVERLDWPTTLNNTAAQKAELIALLDDLQKVNVNVVVFQVRPECDALYQSPYEPWSVYITGNQGSAPSPFYDPLTFAIEEAHKRGMELHAWFNPYRAIKSVNAYSIASNHVINQHPEWVLAKGTLRFLDPGHPEVRNHVTKVILDVVRRYDVDGVHMDDYFYPYEGMGTEDSASWRLYKRGFSDIGDWRRDNVNLLINMIHDSIQVVKNSVKFGMSPFGIWKNGVPSGIIGMSSYFDIYCDPINWMQNKNIDYLTPQLYWPHGGNQDYGKLMRWWADSTYRNGIHFYPGQGVYRINTWSNISEAPNQIRADRNNFPKTMGQVLYRARNGVLDNQKGYTDSLKTNLYKYPALLPSMSWKDQQAPNAPSNLRFERVPGKAVSEFVWNLPASASDGDSADMYVLYNLFTNTTNADTINNAANILTITSNRNYLPGLNLKKYFVVTSLDDNNNESTPSNVIEIQQPAVPVLVSPANNSINQRDTIDFVFNYAANASKYYIQVADDQAFTNLVVNVNTLTDTVYKFAKFTGQKTYYWRVKSINPMGESAYSEVFNFKTGFPSVPTLVYPVHASDTNNVNLNIVWNKEPNAKSYKVQVSTSNIFTSTYLVKDAVVTDTLVPVTGLLTNKIYYYRAMAVNEYGSSAWAPYKAFKTRTTVGVEKEGDLVPGVYSMEQNYPNPFNPVTNIKFSIPDAGNVKINIYDITGNKIGEIVNDYFNAGSYNVSFDASNLASGIYLYALEVNGKNIYKKMTLVK